MKYITLLIITILLGITTNCFAQTPVKKDYKQMKKDEPIPVKTKKGEKSVSETSLKVLAEGSYSGVEEPFILVARDQASLEKISNFPINKIDIKEQVDFEKNIVIAAFAGTKRTGGYSVEISKSGDEISIALLAPPSDAMVTQALTEPFAIVLVPLAENNLMDFKIAETWKSKSQTYQVKNASFEFSGGFAGIQKRFKPKGEIEIYRLNNYVTMILKLKGNDEKLERKLSEIITGEIKDNLLSVEKIGGGTFIENPHPLMKLNAKFSADKILVDLNAHDADYNVSDGFEGKGKFEAVKVN